LQIHVAPFQPRDLIRAIATSIEAETTAKGLRLQAEVAPDVPAIAMGDVGRVRQTLMCLCSNALKFTPAGMITLSCRIETSPTPYLVFDVRDTGIGIELAQLPFIWEAFRQADGSTARLFEGTGLGLALVQRLTRLMGGTVSVASEPGQGSTFTIRLPLALP
jgi:signal transduction histidine kinase